MLWQLLSYSSATSVSWLVVFLEPGRLADDVRGLGVETHIIPAGRMRQPLRGLEAIRRLVQLLHQEQIELVLSWMADSHLYAGPAARLAGTSALWYQLWIPRPTWVDRVATALPARAIVACSETIAAAQRGLRPRRPVQVVHPGVDLHQFDPTRLPKVRELRRRFSLPEDAPIIGFVGRLELWKGPHVLIEAMPAILRKHPQAHCVLVGQPHERSQRYGAALKARIRSLGLDEHVTLAGAQPHTELWMNSMDIIVHTSDQEPFGIVVVEGLALGKPVIAGSAGGPAEVITSGVHGLLSPYGDTRALASAVLTLLDDPVYAAALALAGRRRANDFSSATYVEKMLAVLHASERGA